MATFLRVLKWSAFSLVLLLVIVVIAAAIYTRTEGFNHWVREQAVTAVNDSIRGSISVGRIEGSVWRRLTLFNVALHYEHVDVLRIPRVELAFSLLPLFRGRLEISQIEALKPQADLRQDMEGRWNVVEAVAPRQPATDEDSSFATVIRSLRLRDGSVDLRIAGDEKQVYRARTLSLEGSVDLVPDGVSLDVRELAAALSGAGIPDVSLKGAIEYRQLAGAPPTLKASDLWAVTRHSQLKLDGEVVSGATVQVDARARIDRLAPADFNFFAAEWPLRRDLAGSVAVAGPLSDLEGTLHLTGAGAKLEGRFRVDVTQSDPRYSTTLTVQQFHIGSWLARDDFGGTVSGNLEARGSGFDLKDIAAETKFQIRSTDVEGWAVGTVTVQGRLEKSVVFVDGRVDGKVGGADLSGKVDLKGPRPAYEATMDVANLDIARVAGDKSPLEGNLNFRGNLQGVGFELADMDARTKLTMRPSSIGPIQVVDGQIDASLRNRRLSIAGAALRTADSSLTANGELGLDPAGKGTLSYRFQTADLGSWARLVDRQGRGSVNVTGQARGNFTEIETQGAVRWTGLEIAGVAARSGNGSYALKTAPAEPFPEGVIRLEAVDLESGLALRRVAAKAVFARKPERSIEIDLTAEDRAERKHALQGTLTVASEGLSLQLQQLAVGAPDGTWRLDRPAVVRQRGEAFFVEKLSLRSGVRAVTMDGRFGFAGPQDLRLEAQRLPLEMLAAFLPDQPKMTGLLGAQAHIRGTAAAPEISAQLNLDKATIAGHAYAGAQAEAAYKSGRAMLRVVVRQDASRSLTGDGVLPLQLSWQDQWRAELKQDMEFRVRSSGLSVALLNAFTPKTASDIAGELALDLVARGSPMQPDLRGTFSLREGRVRIVPLGVDVATVSLAGSLDSQKLILREFSARAKDGEIRASGSLALKQYQIGAAQISLNAKRWPAIDTNRYQLRVGGNLEIHGTFAAPVVKGRIVVNEGSLRPDLEFLEQSKASIARDETITIVRNGVPVAPPENGKDSLADGEIDLFENLAVEVSVRAPGNLWIRHPDLQSELSGNVRVSKARQRPLDLTGRIEIVRGWVAFQGRRFQLTKGDVEFTGGGKINPALEIVAEYKLPEYQVAATVGGTMEKPSLTLASQPSLEQADILALLLFGRPINRLNQTEQGSLQQSAINLTSGYVAGRIANSVSNALGLDALGIDIRQVDFSGGRVGFGSYVGRRTFVSVSQEVSGEQGREVSVEYDVTRDWKVGTSTTSTGSSGIDIIWHKRY